MFELLYDFDENEHAYIIKLSPDNYLEIFNELDHYPIRKRDINQNVINYIEDCSNDIPLNMKIKIEIAIKNENKDKNLEERTLKGILNYFRYMLSIHISSSKHTISTSIWYLAIFIVLAIGTFTLETLQININRIFLKTIFEGLSIGSWVFLWEAIAGIVIRNKENRQNIKVYRRLIESKIYFIYI